MLDVHAPHESVHTWRDFFIHIATIVIGLIIAIGLEQSVELIHHHHQLQRAREELRDELNANRRGAVTQLDCVHQVQAELRADMALLLAHRATSQPLTGKLNFDWSFRRSRSAAWNTNKLSGALDLMPHPELAHYDYTFTVGQVVMDSSEKWETELEIAKAIATRSPDGTLSPQDTTELITTISTTQGDLARTERLITFEQGALDDHTFDHQTLSADPRWYPVLTTQNPCTTKGLPLRMRARLEQHFKFTEHQTTWRIEILAGLTTFITMAYIIFVNPAILSQTGMPLAAVTTSTCLCAAFGSIMMGLLANYPLALAPGMGLNAYFTYTVVKGMHVPWQTALGAVFLSGVIFLLLTFGGIRQRLVGAIPHELHAAVAGGIGLFIAFIGLHNAGIIVPSDATVVTLGNMHSPAVLLAIFGIVLIAILQAYKVKASMLIGVLGTLAVGILFHQVKYQPSTFNPMAITATAFHLDIRGALKMNALEIIFVFLFVDLFDNIGTLVAVTERAGLISDDHTIPRLDKIFFADATSTVVGALAGTSTVTSYIESSAGVAAGGRTGVTAITTGLLFFLAIFVAPIVGAIPDFATAPALILVGALMVGGSARIDWDEPRIAIPAFLTLITIPLTYSIATGLSFGLICFAILEIATGRARRQHWMLYLLAVLFLFRFIYLHAS